MRIVNTESSGYSRNAAEKLATLGEVLFLDVHTRQELLDAAAEAEALIVRLRHRIDAEVLQSAPHLRVVVTATTGLNHIDMDAMRNAGVEVLSLRGEQEFLANVTATAELTWGLVLALSRRLTESFGHVKHGGWNRDLLKGNELKSKVLGIVGFGRLGRIVAEYGRAFRMQILATDPHRNDMPDHVERVPMSELLRRADVVSLHVSLDETTAGMIGPDEFRMMKPGAWFVNTSRGELVNEAALLEALESGRLAGAGLDVLADEGGKDGEWLATRPLFRYAQNNPSVIITPHIGGATHESMADTEMFMAEKLIQWCAAHGDGT